MTTFGWERLGGRLQAFTFADGTRVIPNDPFDSDDAQAVIKGVGITQFMRIAIEDELAAGRLNVVLPDIPMFTTPVYVLHAFGRQLPLRARLFIDFLVETLGVPRDLSL
ncbi:LysR substrate-binding domain-containing protein [Bradyrhizobium japonicum]|uniref:LysR substrate-binding domain-containing protein n=1 Tax=Bradyrhizobium japonicum TaxID=375 RepID=UPI002714D1A6|nr:LysR substrate-binding domain-containing protein [Bradyrhizobium japonicum]WLB51406.1 LysR substrate-binding domain-containing protein [Bradyrhizobium japonicum]WLB66824.1 LysR substrate-binding domain-containing protein [Bradyrhizobium japonicum]